MSTLANPEIALTSAPSRPAPPAGKSWLVNPTFDLLFVANLGWPVVALLVIIGGSTLHPHLTFWHQYLLATSHRWITLVIVFFDRERLNERPSTFFGIAAFFTFFVFGVYFSMTSIILLLAIDYAWNAWHFAAQHSGIARIYQRVSQPGPAGRGLFEKTLLRVFVISAIIDLLATMNPIPPSGEWLAPLAYFIRDHGLWLLVFPAILMVRELATFTRTGWGRLSYMTSILIAYSSVIVACDFFARQPEAHSHLGYVVSGLALAIPWIHATEYLAIVSWATKKRKGRAETGFWGYVMQGEDVSMWRYMMPRWAAAMLVFMIAVCAGAILLSRHFIVAFGLITIIVSYLHYAYDGMIWKGRRPASKPASAGDA